MDVRVGEMFAGIGGFRLGLEKANNPKCSCIGEESEQEECKQGRQRIVSEPEVQFRIGQNTAFRVVWANELDKYACQIYRKNFGEKELVEADIKAVNPKDIPHIDMLVAGFPCQPFSYAGKRQGFQDIRGTLFFEIARIAESKRPKLLLLENVRGLLSGEQGYCFWRILSVLDELGYDVEWKILDSQHFGVPQHRERVFIIGYSREGSTKQIFLEPTPSRILGEKNRSKQALEKRLRSSNISPIANCLEASYGKMKNLSNTVANSLSHRYGKDGSEILVMTAHTKANIKQREQQRESTWTLDSSTSKMALVQKSGIRRLTPKECERLQGFPDNWTEGVSDTQRYKVLGNAVTVNVIEFIGKRILEKIQFNATGVNKE